MPSQEPEVTPNSSKSEEEVPVVSSKLKFLVVGQGVAILILLVIIIVTIAYRTINALSGEAKQPLQKIVIDSKMEHPALEGPVSDVTRNTTAPKGSALRAVHAGDAIVTLEFTHENGNTTLVFIETKTGQEKSRVLIER